MWWWVVGYFAIGWLVVFYVSFSSNLVPLMEKEGAPNFVRVAVKLFFFMLWPLIPFVKGLK